MAENYTKDIKESVYHGALAVGYKMLGKTLIKIRWCKVSSYHSNV